MPESLLSIDVQLAGPRGGAKKTTLHFKNLSGVPIGIVRATRHDATEQMWRVFEWALATDDLASLDEVPLSKALTVLSDMQRASD